MYLYITMHLFTVCSTKCIAVLGWKKFGEKDSEWNCKNKIDIFS